MSTLSRFTNALKAAHQLGLSQLGLYTLYRLGLHTGYYQMVESKPQAAHTPLVGVFPIPERQQVLDTIGKSGFDSLMDRADEIVHGKVRLFGGDPVELRLSGNWPLGHWAEYETGKIPLDLLDLPYDDIKFIWEPARFGWAFTLGRAYYLSGEERFAETFWQYFEEFISSNPPYEGPNWMSGQEVAIRLMAFVWSAQIFADSASSHPVRMEMMAQSVAEHAARIPLTMVYARSQNNNHLLSEAAGLFTAGLALPSFPLAASWRDLGWKWLNYGFQNQIDDYGEYVQHSTNYQRLVLQIGLWVDALARKHGISLPKESIVKLSAATHWLLTMFDRDSGRVSNLGANDGAYIFPLTECGIDDFRPVIQSAAAAFSDGEGVISPILPGIWDEMCLWFGHDPHEVVSNPFIDHRGSNMRNEQLWLSLRAKRFKSRPSHADQLHLDLWWRGINVTRDAGTYLYNARPPWDNALTTALVHNTITVDGQDQMSRVGRFLYLDWTEADIGGKNSSEDGSYQNLNASHLLKIKNGLLQHNRTATYFSIPRNLKIEDEIQIHRHPWAVLDEVHVFRLHWLLPDWDYEIAASQLRLLSPFGWITLTVTTNQLEKRVALVRAGELLHGEGMVQPFFGWYSPTYAQKLPALSLAVEVGSTKQANFTSEFWFPE